MERDVTVKIAPHMDVFDFDGHKVGTVAHVYERPAPSGAGVDDEDSIFEVKTGLFGLGKHLYIPFSAVKDVTEGGIFLGKARADFEYLGWYTKPDFLAHPDSAGQVAAPARSIEMAQPATAVSAAAGAEGQPTDWEAIKPYYRARWSEHYGTSGAQWENYEARYRFAWEMGNVPEFQGKSWLMVQPELRNRWEVLHPDKEWDTVSETVRDAWEHPYIAGQAETSPRTESGAS